MGQVVGKVSDIFRCNLRAIQTGGSRANTILAADEVWLVDTTNSLTNSLSGNCDAYIVGDGTTAASALELKRIEIYGEYVDNPEFINVKTDSNGRVLWGIRPNGRIYYGAGVPPQVEERMQDVASGKVDAEEGKGLIDENYAESQSTTDNPEWLYLIKDNDEHIFFGVKSDGNIDWSAGIPKHLKEYIDKNDIDAKKDTEIRKWLGFILDVDSASLNDVLFTDDDVAIGSDYYVSFVLTTSNGGVGLFNSNDERIAYYGLSPSSAGAIYSGKMTIPNGFKYAKVIWGGLTDVKVYEYADYKDLSERVSHIEESLDGVSIQPYFSDEMEQTISSILSHASTPAVVLPILTDSHWGLTERAKEQTFETIANVKYLCNSCYCDGVIHLGDILMSSWNATLLNEGKSQAEADVITERMMSQYLNKYASAHPEKHLYAVGGNHDGDNLQVFKYAKWYAMIGRKENGDGTIVKNGEAPYFYVDYNKCNLRCVFLQQPNDYDNNGVTTFGYTADMLEWLASEALDVADGTHVVIFSHIAPLQASYVTGGILENRSSFYGVCNAFNNHTTFTDSVVTCDFSNLQTSKILCYVCGHTHGDRIFSSGETYNGKYTTDGTTFIDHTYENGLPCSLVVITNTYVGNSGDGTTPNSNNFGEIYVPRSDKSVTQEAWDVFLFNPSEKKIHFIRFGSGADRVLDLTNII